jgi:hypothetical protein
MSARTRRLLACLLSAACAATFAAADEAPAALALSAEQVMALHVATTALASAADAPPLEGYAQVLDAGALVALLDEAGAAQETARESAREAARLQTLSGNDDVSRKAAGAARVQAAADRARSDTLAARIALEWSPALAQPDAALVADLRRGARRLLRLEFGDRADVGRGSDVSLTPLLGTRKAQPAKILGAANGAAAILPGPAWLAVAAATDMHPGERLRAQASAPALHGVLVPAPAIVQMDGASWAYVRRLDGAFQRRALPPDGLPLRDGILVTSGFAAGEQVVTAGAAQLLGAERKPADEATTGESD